MTCVPNSDARPAKLKIVNKLEQPLHVWWIATNGSRQERYDIAPGKTANIKSRAGHVFAVESEDGSFDGLAYPSTPPSSYVVQPPSS